MVLKKAVKSTTPRVARRATVSARVCFAPWFPSLNVYYGIYCDSTKSDQKNTQSFLDTTPPTSKLTIIVVAEKSRRYGMVPAQIPVFLLKKET